MDSLLVALVLPALLYGLPVSVMLIKKWWTPRRNLVALCAAIVVNVAMYVTLIIVEGVSPGTVVLLAVSWLAPTVILALITLQGIQQYERENTLPDDASLRWNLKRKRS